MRLFIAIYPDADMLREVVRAQEHVSKIASGSLRLLSKEQLHMTIKFLGEVEEEALLQLQDSLMRIARTKTRFTLTINSLGCFPSGGRIRIVWAGTSTPPELTSYTAELDRELKTLGFVSETREFIPHITIARADKNGEPASLRKAIANFTVKPIAQEILYISLMRSHLTRSGANYEEVCRTELLGPIYHRHKLHPA